MGALTSICNEPQKKTQSLPKLPERVETKQTKVALVRQPVQSPPPPPPVIPALEEMYPSLKQNKRVKLTDFNLKGMLGKGGFGSVYLAELKENVAKGISQNFAIKMVRKKDVFDKRMSENINLEKNILSSFYSKFVASLSFAFQDDVYFYFVMECALGGDTYSLIKLGSNRHYSYRALGEEAVRFIAGCLVLGLEYLHSKEIMYRDLKPENMLIFQNGYVKLTDFGLAKRISPEEIAKTEAGTAIYYAPEMILRTGYNKEIDFWEMGVYLFEMSVYVPPFNTSELKEKQKIKKIVIDAETKRDWKESNLSPELKDLINRLLKFDPQSRIGVQSWKEIKTHAFFNGFDWKQLEDMTMPSPLKGLIEKYPIQIKPVVADFIKDHQKTLNSKANVEGFSYVRPATVPLPRS